MIRKILALIFILLSLGFVNAKTLDSVSLYELNYSDFSVARGNYECNSYDIQDMTTIENSAIIFNLIIENYIPVKENLKIDLYLNDTLEKTLENKDILAENYIKINSYFKAKNNIKICIDNDALPKITISKNSNLGSYLLGEIEEGAGFYQRILTKDTFNSTLLPIELYAYNSGSAPLFINIKHANETFLKNSNLETVSGQTTYSGIIEPEQIITLKYFLKTDKNIKFATPRAELTYTDHFGNEQKIYAKQEIISISENQNKIEMYVDLKTDVLVNVPRQGKIIIKNNSQEDIKNIYLETSFPEKIIVSQRQIPVLKKFEVVEIPFEIMTINRGQFKFDSSIYYNLGEIENGTKIQTITINSDLKKDYVKETIGIFLIITIAIYVWIVRF